MTAPQRLGRTVDLNIDMSEVKSSHLLSVICPRSQPGVRRQVRGASTSEWECREGKQKQVGEENMAGSRHLAVGCMLADYVGRGALGRADSCSFACRAAARGVLNVLSPKLVCRVSQCRAEFWCSRGKTVFCSECQLVAPIC